MHLNILYKNQFLEQFSQSHLYIKHLTRGLVPLDELDVKIATKKFNQKKLSWLKWEKRNSKLRKKTPRKYKYKLRFIRHLSIDDCYSVYQTRPKRKKLKTTGYFIRKQSKMLSSKFRKVYKYNLFINHKNRKLSYINLLKQKFRKIKTNQKKLLLMVLN